MKIDWVGRPSWQAQLSGIKTWMLVPPPECEHCCKSLNITVDTGDISKYNKVLHQHVHYVYSMYIMYTACTLCIQYACLSHYDKLVITM